jgi:signal transduction histidine kinase
MQRRQSKLVFGIACTVVLAMLGGLVLVLAHSQSNDRRDLEERFSRRPQVSAALTSALFSATSTTPEQQKQLNRRYGGKTVSTDALTQDARQNNSVFKALLDDQGQLIAISAGAPPGVREELQSAPSYVQSVLTGQQPVALTDFLDLDPGGAQTQAFAQPIETDFGRRILVTGFPPELLAAFLGQTLSKLVEITGGQAYILDSAGVVVASSNPESVPGEPVTIPGLAQAFASRDAGSFGSDQYFAASAIDNSTWRVVATAPESDVFASVRGWDEWTPWLILAAFALALAAAFALLWRVLRNADELSDAHEQLDASNRALQLRARDLERSNAELDQFASIASHDLQEPLRKVQMFSQRVFELESDQLSDKARDYLQRSTDAAGRMQLLIEDLLKFSRVATQGRPFVSADLEEVAREVASDLEGAIEAADATVEIGELPRAVVDEPQIRQLFQNLISNAIKFRREGIPPVVRIDGEVRGRYAEIRVSDNGIGFEPRYASRIFRVFERLHGRGEYPGTGIGLALCRKIVERHGGTISAESTPGAGSTFTVMLPRSRVREPQFVVPNGHPDHQKAEPAGV